MFVVLIAAASGFYAGSRKSKVTSKNVNDEWTGSVTTQSPTLAAVAA
jgi:hypothetical protein